ncbi:CASP-like protein 1D1 [Corylus avellana]|uniref:CASP-like protein 1D1 n=1 Tax=Corylus avellana TaxID=13451 RepID=UPI00286D3C82|nr:CASP-like protein 1D1 [Corylus avellana]
MASTDKPGTEYYKEVQPPPPPAEQYFVVNVALRVLLFASVLTAVLVVVTSDQTKLIPGLGINLKAKFNQSPAFIYFVVALSVTGLYGIITILASISVLFKPISSTKFMLHFAVWDVLILGLVASAMGSAGGIAYVGLKGNEHVHWGKVCNTFDKFCRHMAGSLAVSLFASFVLVLLIWLSIFTLHRRIPK